MTRWLLSGMRTRETATQFGDRKLKTVTEAKNIDLRIYHPSAYITIGSP